MEIPEALNSKIQDLQTIERSLQNISMEKQSLQVELNQIDNALMEIEKAKGDVFKILNGIMVKSDRDTLKKELSEKKKILDLRVNSVEKQEAPLDSRADKLREEINSALTDKNKG